MKFAYSNKHLNAWKHNLNIGISITSIIKELPSASTTYPLALA
jgi:hypothetical protein